MRPRAAIPGVMAIGLTLGLMLGRTSPPAPTLDSEVAPGIRAPADIGTTPEPTVTGADDATPPASLAAAPPMPALDAPLADSWPALLARAEAGDGPAACRLAASLLGCRLHWGEQRASALAERLATERPYQDEEVLAAVIEAAASDAYTPDWVATTCGAAAPGLEAELPALLLRLAQTGNAEAMTLYANLGNSHLSVAALSPGQRRAWREHAPAMVERLIDAGRLDGVFMAAGRFGDPGPGLHPLGQVRPGTDITEHLAMLVVFSAGQRGADARVHARRLPLLPPGVDRDALVARVSALEQRLGPPERRARSILMHDPSRPPWGMPIAPDALDAACAGATTSR